MSQHVLLISCADRVGLIHAVTGVLLKYQLNIIENGEFVDHNQKMFFMRTAFAGAVKIEALERELRATLPTEAVLSIHEKRKKRVLLLGTREPHCLGDLLLRHESGELNAHILAVLSQYDTLKTLVGRFGVPFHLVPHVGMSREDHENDLLKIINQYQPEYLVLAKYMRILTPNFIRHFPKQIINIHHSFLPAFIGKNPYQQAYERGVKIIGATAHFVNDKLDEGPIVTQNILPVDHKHNALDMEQAGRDVEKVTLASALRLAFEDRILIHNERTIIF